MRRRRVTRRRRHEEAIQAKATLMTSAGKATQKLSKKAASLKPPLCFCDWRRVAYPSPSNSISTSGSKNLSAGCSPGAPA